MQWRETISITIHVAWNKIEIACNKIRGLIHSTPTLFLDLPIKYVPLSDMISKLKFRIHLSPPHARYVAFPTHPLISSQTTAISLYSSGI
jgi:hypothetical protein